jgi:catechol 2,3-dioxygenase-like lactoylglutathione lyase family enzyme
MSGLKHRGLDHLAIFVFETESGLQLWRDTFGFRLLTSEAHLVFDLEVSRMVPVMRSPI